MNSFFSSKKNIAVLIGGILFIIILIPIIGLIASVGIDQLLLGGKKQQIRENAIRTTAFYKILVQLDTHMNEHDTFPRAEDGGLTQALNLPFDSSSVFQYAYCLSNEGKATSYHLGIQEMTYISLPTEKDPGIDFNSNSPNLSSLRYGTCNGKWYLENGTPGGFDGREIYDVVCTKGLLCDK